MTKFDGPLKPAQIRLLKDPDLDFSEAPELDQSFWQHAELIEPDRTEQISLRVRRSVLQWFRQQGRGYQTRINRVLETYVHAPRDRARRRLDEFRPVGR